MRATVLVVLVALLTVSLVPMRCEPSHPHILIDTGHGGYPLKEGRLSEFSQFASDRGFSVEFENIKKVDLSTFCLVLSVNPDVPFSSEDAHLLKNYLEQGGTLFLTGSGDYDNRDHSEVTNPLLELLGSKTRYNDDQLKDEVNAGKPYIPLFGNWNPHPLTKSLPPISLYSPESLILGNAYPLLQGNPTTISEDTDGTITSTDPGMTLLAVERTGMGDLLIGGSWWFLSGFTFPGHQEFAEQLFSYVSEKVTIPLYQDLFHGATLVIGKECRTEVDRKGAETLQALLSGTILFEESELPTIIIGGPEVNPLAQEVNPYLPIQFGKDETWYFTRGIQHFTGQNYGVIALVTIEGRTLLIVAGLGGTGTRGGVNLLVNLDTYSLKPTYNEYGEAVLFSVSGDSTLNGVEEVSEEWTISIL